MRYTDRLHARARARQSQLCVGLDPDPRRFAEGLTPENLWRFCTETVTATAPYALAFKPQIAYFAALRAESLLEELCAFIRETDPSIPIILDSKRGDIGSTAERYAIEAFERYGADAVTLSPYMGWDTVEPFLTYEDRGVYLLCRTSNPHSNDLQGLIVEGEPLYLHIARRVNTVWSGHGQVGLVVGATYPEDIKAVRAAAPEASLLIPGIGAQGGSMDVARAAGARADGLGAVLNVGRAILYPEGETQKEAAQRYAAASYGASLL